MTLEEMIEGISLLIEEAKTEWLEVANKYNQHQVGRDKVMKSANRLGLLDEIREELFRLQDLEK